MNQVNLRPHSCPISGVIEARMIFSYDAPPPGEIGFRRPAGEPYRREVWQFAISEHFVSRHVMTVATDYTGDYVNSTYGNRAGIEAAFERVIALPAARSDNAGRIKRIEQFAESRFGNRESITLLDIGAGLGVFPYAVKKAGWRCTALDPDPRACEHIQTYVGVEAVCADFMKVENLGRYDIVTLNKVLEHVDDPISMLKRARNFLLPGGFVYLEVPDGEMAMREGAEREEFFIEHLHVFSFASVTMLATRAGFVPLVIERLQEPSTKFTLRAILAASGN
ncbi:MAG: class I SAM-dependent methyltransferase [Afipia sp.]|nr:class I SAM-dependent methyltransferase [Afipia sp.]